MTRWLLLVLAGCTLAPLPPAPPPPGPELPAEQAQDCEGAHARAVRLGCAGSDSPRWIEACRRYSTGENAGTALDWRPGCQASAESCEEQTQCREGLR